MNLVLFGLPKPKRVLLEVPEPRMSSGYIVVFRYRVV